MSISICNMCNGQDGQHQLIYAGRVRQECHNRKLSPGSRGPKAEGTNKHTTWTDVLAAIKSDAPSINFYFIVVDKETTNEKRSRFLTRAEALELVIYEIEKARNEKS